MPETETPSLEDKHRDSQPHLLPRIASLETLIRPDDKQGWLANLGRKCDTSDEPLL